MSTHFRCDCCGKEMPSGIGYLGTVSLTLAVPKFNKITKKAEQPYRKFKINLSNSCIECVHKIKFERIPELKETEKDYLKEQLPILIGKLLSIEHTKTEIE